MSKSVTEIKRDARDARIAAAFLAGKSCTEIAKTEGIHHSTVSRVLLKDGEIKTLVDQEQRAMVAYVPEARQTLYNIMKTGKPDATRLKAAETILQATSVIPGHTQSTLFVNLYQDNRTVESHVWNILSDKLSEMLPPPDNDKDIVDVSPDAGPDEPRAQGK